MDEQKPDNSKYFTTNSTVAENKNDDPTNLTSGNKKSEKRSDGSPTDSTVFEKDRKLNIVKSEGKNDVPDPLGDIIPEEDVNDNSINSTMSDEKYQEKNDAYSLIDVARIGDKNNITLEVADEFYNAIQRISSILNKESNLSYITSRSSSEYVNIIEKLCSEIETICKNEQIPIKESASKSNYPSVELFKYLICNTNFSSQPILADDIVNGHFVDMQPPFSSYLLVEILWHLHFEEILAESILHLPLDLCPEILEILPRCLDLLDFHRSNKLLSTIIPNVYKKLMISKESGTQTKDIHYNVKKLVGILQELMLQYNGERFLKLEDLKKTERYKRQGIVLKKIIQMVKTCFISKNEKFEILPEMAKMYKLTFGHEPVVRIADGILQEYLKEIDRELINLLLGKVKEIDCHVYLNWTEYDDEENTSLTLQRGIGLECYYFVEHTKKYMDVDDNEYNHLVECILQLASKPDPDNKIESLQIEDLYQGVMEGKKDCLTTVFKRYKEWDDTTIDLIDNNFHLLSKEDCEEIFEYFTAEIRNASKQSDFVKLQNFAGGLLKSFVGLKILEAYELTIQQILRYEENDNIQNVQSIENFEKFIMLNPNFSTPRNLRVILFYLCLQPKLVLKIILKITLGHSDYPDVAINLDELMSLLPIMKIRMPSQYKNEMDSLRAFLHGKSNGLTNGESHADCPETVSFVVKTLQEICLESSKWNKNNLSNLLCMLYSFCEFSEVINEVLTPIISLESYPSDYVQWILVELDNVSEKFDSKINKELPFVLEKRAFNLFKSNGISKFVVDESLTLIAELRNRLLSADHKPVSSNYSTIFLGSTVSLGENQKLCLTDNIERVMNLCREKMNNIQFSSQLKTEDILRYLFFKCTNQQFSQYIKEITDSFGSEALNWSSKLEVYDNVIRLGFESCLLSLEYPSTGPEDNISFTIRRLYRLILELRNSKMNSNFVNEVCKSLEAHAALINPSAEQSAISKEYTVLLNSFHESNLIIDSYLTALDLFALGCVQKSSMLQNFEGSPTSLGTRLWLVHDILDKLLFEEVIAEDQFFKLEESLK